MTIKSEIPGFINGEPGEVFKKLDLTRILAIDPGPEKSGVVIYCVELKRVQFALDMRTDELISKLETGEGINSLVPDYIVSEDIVSYMEQVGKTTFDTVKVIGELRAISRIVYSTGLLLINRPDVKTVLAGGGTFMDMKTKRQKGITDSMVRRIVESKFPQTGGGSRPAIGTKVQPGPLYHMKGKQFEHSWQALAVALTFVQTELKPKDGQ